MMRGLNLDQLNDLDEARRIVTSLAERNKTQGHLLVTWKRRLKEQVCFFDNKLINNSSTILF